MIKLCYITYRCHGMGWCFIDGRGDLHQNVTRANPPFKVPAHCTYAFAPFATTLNGGFARVTRILFKKSIISIVDTDSTPASLRENPPRPDLGIGSTKIHPKMTQNNADGHHTFQIAYNHSCGLCRLNHFTLLPKKRGALCVSPPPIPRTPNMPTG